MANAGQPGPWLWFILCQGSLIEYLHLSIRVSQNIWRRYGFEENTTSLSWLIESNERRSINGYNRPFPLFYKLSWILIHLSVSGDKPRI